MSLRARLIVIVLMALIPSLLLMLDTAYENYRTRLHDAQQHVQHYALVANKYHESMVSETRLLLDVLKKLPQIHSPLHKDCEPTLEKMLFGNIRYANFAVINLQGKAVCSAVPQEAATDLSDREYYKEAIRNKTLSVGDYQIGRIVNKPVQVIAQPVLDEQDNVQGVIYASLYLDWLKGVVPVNALPADSSVTVFDRQGVVLSRDPDPQSLWTGIDIKQALPVLANVVSNRDETWLGEATGLDGVKRVYALYRFGTVDNPYGYIMVGIPSEPIYAVINAELLPHLAIIAAAIFVITLLGWFGSEFLVLKRTRRLSQLVRAIGDGDYAARIRVEGNDEISRLADDINTMAEKLGTSRKRIHKLTRIQSVLSGINSAILRIRDRDNLLQEACHIAVDHGGLSFAWIGLFEEDGKLSHTASYGDGKAYLHQHCLPSLSNNESNYPCAAAVRSEKPVIFNNLKNEVNKNNWSARVVEQGYQSMASFPLLRQESLIGTVNLYSNEKNFFTEYETKLFLELSSDISLGLEYIDKDKSIKDLLYYDVLTNLPNRKLCEDRLQQAISHAARRNRLVAVMEVNISDFRRKIGLYGNHISDEVLSIVGNLLKKQLREGDTVARLEGDVFAVVFSDLATMDDAQFIPHKVITAMPTSVMAYQQDIHLQLNAGVAIFPDDGNDAKTLMSHASFAIVQHKSQTQHQLNFYSPQIQHTAHQRNLMELALRNALENQSELELHYQPVVDIETQEIISFEALCRWHSAQFGSVSPAQFIPIAEESGLIVPLGEWALKTACEQVVKWNEQGFKPVRIAVNVSFRQFRDEFFMQRLDEIFNQQPGCAYDQIAIEITESEVMDNIETTVSILNQLSARNMYCYIDDFGTGYSSLSYLHNLPLDVLKIDQSFVANMVQSENSVSIVRSIIMLAKNLKLKTLAEGVETVEQLEMLRQLGCDYIQGYLFSRPMPAAELSAIMQKNNRLEVSE